ncbi:MAG: glycosyltransferase family 4 protein, partial [Actinomycetota bacterium]
TEAVRQIDQSHLVGVHTILAASEVVKERLRHFNGLDANVGVYHAGTGLTEELVVGAGPSTFDHVLCVSRHEFPKRTELFVHALAYLPETQGVLVGAGGRLPWIRTLHARLARRGINLDEISDEDLWLCTAPPIPSPKPPDRSNLRLLDHVGEADLAHFYNTAACVVAPAYLEDYGLTAIEAMSWGKPLVVCKDGGGLVSFVEDGVNGFVVEPRGTAIADAVRRLTDDPALAREMGEHGREMARRFTWERGLEEVAAGLDAVAG